MNLDQLTNSLRKLSKDRSVQNLVKLLEDWKKSDGSVEKLNDSFDRNLGYSGIESATEHQAVFDLWSRFQEVAIVPIRGMTMNERLVLFSLLEEFEGCTTDDERARYYAKLLASR